MQISPISSTFFYRNYNLYRFDRRTNLINDKLLIENIKLKNQYFNLVNMYSNNTNKLSFELSSNQLNTLNQNYITIKNSIIDYLNSEIKSKFDLQTIKNYDLLLKDPQQTTKLINSGLIYLSPNLKTINLDLYNSLISPVSVTLDTFLNDVQLAQETVSI